MAAPKFRTGTDSKGNRYYLVDTYASGKRRPKRAKTLKEARELHEEDRRARFNSKHGLGPSPTERRIRVSARKRVLDLVPEHLAWLKENGGRVQGEPSAGHVKARERYVKIVCEGMGNPAVSQIDWKAARDVIESMMHGRKPRADQDKPENRETRPNGPRTWNAYTRNVKAFGAWLKREEYCDVNPFERLQNRREPEPEPRPLAIEETYRLLSLVDIPKQHDPWRESVAKRIRKRALFYRFKIFTGLRGTELHRLTFDMIDFANETITITSEVQKKWATTLTLPLSSKAMGVLHQLRGTGSAKIFPERVDRITFLRDCVRAGIGSSEKNVAAQGIAQKSTRATFSQFADDAGVDPIIAERLTRHAMNSIREKHYLKRSSERREAEGRVALDTLCEYYDSEAAKLDNVAAPREAAVIPAHAS